MIFLLLWGCYDSRTYDCESQHLQIERDGPLRVTLDPQDRCIRVRDRPFSASYDNLRTSIFPDDGTEGTTTHRLVEAPWVVVDPDTTDLRSMKIGWGANSDGDVSFIEAWFGIQVVTANPGRLHIARAEDGYDLFLDCSGCSVWLPTPPRHASLVLVNAHLKACGDASSATVGTIDLQATGSTLDISFSDPEAFGPTPGESPLLELRDTLAALGDRPNSVTLRVDVDLAGRFPWLQPYDGFCRSWESLPPDAPLPLDTGSEAPPTAAP